MFVKLVQKGAHPSALLGLIETNGKGYTDTTAVAKVVHVPIEPITVYVVEAPGLAITVAPVILFNPVEGLHA